MVLKKAAVLFFFVSLFPFLISAQDTLRPDTLFRKKTLVEDDPVVSMLDSLATLKIFEDAEFPKANQYQNWATYTDNDVPVFPDSVYRERIAQMNDQSPFEYVYNPEVKKFIDLYGVRKRKLTARILGLAQIYFPLFEEQLDKYNMPLELKYLAVIESALNPTANSPAGAKGLWQFMYGTGKGYGLKVSSYVDDRYDPYKATIAACEHLSDLYDIYGSWSLALAAYNSGAGNVNKAIRRSGGMKNFWAIKKFLPKETASYVPAFIAASYVMTYAAEHKIYPVDPGILYYEVDTVTVRSPLAFDQISEMLNIPMDEIEFLNPSFKHWFIPATADNPYKLRLRKKYIGNFINNEQALYAYETRSGKGQDSLQRMLYANYRETELYTVKSGETVSSVAKKFHMSTSELKSLNGLKKNSIKPNKKIMVYSKSARDSGHSSGVTSTYVPSPAPRDTSVKPNPAVSQPAKETGKTTTKTENPSTAAATKTHVVKTGESLTIIAGKYHCTSADLVKWNNLASQKIVVGQKLKVSAPVSSAVSETEKGETAPKQSKSSNVQKYTYYTIQSGDNLWDIAEKHDVTVAQLKSANNLKTNSRLKPGQRLKIPK
jgi:membrane-bound lytic murein transglycosylase D